MGQRADLVLSDAKPLASVEALRPVEAVVVNGFASFREDLDALLNERAASVTAPLQPTALEPAPGTSTVLREHHLRDTVWGKPSVPADTLG